MAKARFRLTNVTEFTIPDETLAKEDLRTQTLHLLRQNLLNAAGRLANFTLLTSATDAKVLKSNTSIVLDATGLDEEVDKLIQEAIEASAAEHWYDEIVRDCADRIGAAVNNDGMEEQFRFILGELGVKDGAAKIRETTVELRDCDADETE